MALSKTGRFLTKAEILGVGVFSPLPIFWRSSEFTKPGEIQKGTGGRGQDRKCHKLSQNVVTFYDEFYDVL